MESCVNCYSSWSLIIVQNMFFIHRMIVLRLGSEGREEVSVNWVKYLTKNCN